MWIICHLLGSIQHHKGDKVSSKCSHFSDSLYKTYIYLLLLLSDLALSHVIDLPVARFVPFQLEKVVNSQAASNSILKKSKTDFINIDDEEVIDVDESNARFDIIDSGSDNGDDDGHDEDEFDCGGVPEDPMESFSDLKPNGFGDINHGTKLGISEQKVNSLSSKTSLVEHSENGSKISEVSQAEKSSSHDKRECRSNDDNGHTGSNDDDDDDDDDDGRCGDSNHDESDAYEDLQCRSVDGETCAVKSDSESDSSIELTRPRFR